MTSNGSIPDTYGYRHFVRQRQVGPKLNGGGTRRVVRLTVTNRGGSPLTSRTAQFDLAEAEALARAVLHAVADARAEAALDGREEGV